MIKRPLFILFLLPVFAAGQNQNYLDRYITEGLKNNLALQQQEFSLEKNLQALKEAKGMFYPSVSVLARYSRAGGGRMIDFPVGDMLNPIYESLNDLYRIQNIDAYFPTNIPNQQFPFLREEEQETKIRIVQPIYQRSLYQNVKLQTALSRVQTAQVEVFKRQLISDIQTSYYNYAKTLNIDRLLEQTRELMEENLRISKKLVDIGKSTEDTVFRAQAEMAEFDQKKAEAEKNKTLAAAYFNFLLNRDIEEPILLDDMPPPSLLREDNLEKAIERALNNRTEFQQLRQAIAASSHLISLAGSGTLPSLFAVVDYGIQGETFSFGRDADYWMASLIFEWSVFNGNRNQAKKAQAMLDRKKLEAQMLELENKIRMQVHEAYQSYLTAKAAVRAAEKREESAEKSYAIVAKMYANGMTPQITLLDARNAFTSASVNRIMAFYDLYLEKARFEQVTALFDLSLYQGEEGDDNVS